MSPKWHATSVACANIALAKYWGKSDVALNLPAVPSISMTLDGLVTETAIALDPKLDADEVELDGRPATAAEAIRVTGLLDDVRNRSGRREKARVASRNLFPTAAGLASSASGFAALAAAADRAYDLGAPEAVLSAIARQASASAARSIYGGFVELPAGEPGDADLAATPLAPAEHWDLRIVVAQTAKGPKKVGSTEGMERSRRTSPFYEAWLSHAPAIADRIRAALERRDLDSLGAAMEQSTMAFHGCAMTSEPGILYWQPATIAALHAVRGLRDERGLSVWATMDAGPHVKALCHADHAAEVRKALREAPGVVDTLIAAPGPGVQTR